MSLDDLISECSRLLSKVESVGYKSLNLELIGDCYYFIMQFPSSIDEGFKGFCSELRTHVMAQHHFPKNYNVIKRWRDSLIYYLNYIRDNIDFLFRI